MPQEQRIRKITAVNINVGKLQNVSVLWGPPETTCEWAVFGRPIIKSETAPMFPVRVREPWKQGQVIG